MRKSVKVLIAVLGATDTMFSVFIPIGLALLLIPFVSGWGQTALILIGILSSLYRAIDVGLLVK